MGFHSRFVHTPVCGCCVNHQCNPHGPALHFPESIVPTHAGAHCPQPCPGACRHSSIPSQSPARAAGTPGDPRGGAKQ